MEYLRGGHYRRGVGGRGCGQEEPKTIRDFIMGSWCPEIMIMGIRTLSEDVVCNDTLKRLLNTFLGGYCTAIIIGRHYYCAAVCAAPKIQHMLRFHCVRSAQSPSLSRSPSRGLRKAPGKLPDTN